MYNVVSVIPVSRDNSATDRFAGGIIFFNTESLSSCEYLDIFHHLSPPALRGLTENGDNYSDAGGPKGFEFNDQINDVMYMITKHCQRTGVEPEKIQSVHDYIACFGSKEKQEKGSDSIFKNNGE